jgi:S-adenosylhomocysteine hydrolase
VDATAAGAHKLLQLAADSTLLVPAMNVSDAVTHSRFAASQSDRVKASLVQGLHTLCGVDVAGKVTCSSICNVSFMRCTLYTRC